MKHSHDAAAARETCRGSHGSFEFGKLVFRIASTTVLGNGAMRGLLLAAWLNRTGCLGGEFHNDWTSAE